jgi:hypothetical protein
LATVDAMVFPLAINRLTSGRRDGFRFQRRYYLTHVGS